MKRIPVLHPYLFTLASIVFLYPFTSVISSPGQTLRPLFAFWAFLFILSLIAKKLVHERNWLAILLTIFVVGFCASRLFFILVTTISITSIALWLGISILRKRKLKVDQITIILYGISIILTMFSLARVFTLFKDVPWPAYRRALNAPNMPISTNQALFDYQPDIYYIVLDGYARSDSLSNYYGYDNSEFIEKLEKVGFFVPENSYSNYPKTALSVASTLNMNYISEISPGLDNSFFWWLMSPLIDHSQVRAILEQTGYRSVSIATDWSITDNPTTEYYLKPYPIHLNDFEGYLLNSTPIGLLSPVLNDFSNTPSHDSHRFLVNYSFDSLSDIPELAGPKFVFAHIITPHPPFVFDDLGNPVSPDYLFNFNDANDYPGTDDEYRNSYLAQLEYVNKRILRVVDDIFTGSDNPPIIIIQADHGPGMLTDFRSSEDTCLQERFAIFAAYYLPNLDLNPVPQDITPVNIFRIVLNEYFAIDSPLLENSYYYYKDTIYIYRSEDISESLEDDCFIGSPDE